MTICGVQPASLAEWVFFASSCLSFCSSDFKMEVPGCMNPIFHLKYSLILGMLCPLHYIRGWQV